MLGGHGLMTKIEIVKKTVPCDYISLLSTCEKTGSMFELIAAEALCYHMKIAFGTRASAA